MSFSNDREDAVAMALSVTHGLMEAHGLHPSSIGRLEVRNTGGLIPVLLYISGPTHVSAMHLQKGDIQYWVRGKAIVCCHSHSTE